MVVGTPAGMEVIPFVTAKLVICVGGPATISNVTDPELIGPEGPVSVNDTEGIGALAVFPSLTGVLCSCILTLVFVADKTVPVTAGLEVVNPVTPARPVPWIVAM